MLEHMEHYGKLLLFPCPIIFQLLLDLHPKEEQKDKQHQQDWHQHDQQQWDEENNEYTKKKKKKKKGKYNNYEKKVKGQKWLKFFF